MNHVPDRYHVMLPDISNFRAYQKMIQEQMMHENKSHDKHFPALVTSTRVQKPRKLLTMDVCFSETRMLPMITLPMM